MQDRSAFDELQNILVGNSHMNADVKKSNRLEMVVMTPGDNTAPNVTAPVQMDLTITKRARPYIQHRLRITPASQRGYVKSETWLYEPETQDRTAWSQGMEIPLEMVLDQLRGLLTT